MHYPSRVRKAFGPPFLLGITSLGSIALEQFHLIKIPILIVFVWVTSSAILSKYFHSLILFGVTTSSSPTGKSVLAYVTGRPVQTGFPMDFDTFNPLNASDSWVSSPFKVLILIVVFIPSALSCLAKSVRINVPFDGLPFTNCAVDMFGPFLIKEGRKELKRYGALFTCLASRAVHIECTCSMDTDSFIQALRQFIAKRGNIRILRCDNGSNFVGTQRELAKAFQEMDH